MSDKKPAKPPQKKSQSKKKSGTVRNTLLATAFLGAGGYFGFPYADSAAQGTFIEPAFEIVTGRDAVVGPDSESAIALFKEMTYTVEDFEIKAEAGDYLTWKEMRAMNVAMVAKITRHGRTGQDGYHALSLSSFPISAEHYESLLKRFFLRDRLHSTQIALMTPYVAENDKSVTFRKEALSPSQEEGLKSFILFLNTTDTLTADQQARIDYYMAVYSTYMSTENLEALLAEDSPLTQQSMDIVANEIVSRKTPSTPSPTGLKEQTISSPYTSYLPRFFK